MLKQLALDCGHETERIVDFLRERSAQAGFSRFVVGLSGGIDSALAAFLAARAVGAENVLCVMMPYLTSNPASEGDARRVIAALDLPYRKIEITNLVEPFFALDDEITPGRKGNIMARARMMVLYDLSVAWNGLVLGTSNRTETLLGYFTLFGDGAAAIKPIAHLYKCQVNDLAAYLGVPEAVVTKAPSADLWAGQTDEGELGFSYDDADQALYLLDEQGFSTSEITAMGFDAKTVVAIERRMKVMSFKRDPVPDLVSDQSRTPK